MSILTDKDFNQRRAIFIKRAASPALPANVLKLAYVLAFVRMNRKTQATFYTNQQTLADHLGGIEIRSVRRLLRTLKLLGLQIEGGLGRGNASVYRIGPQHDDTEKRTPESSFRGAKSGLSTTEKRTLNDREKRTLESPLLNLREPNLTGDVRTSPREGEGERDEASLRSPDDLPSADYGGPDGAASAESFEESKQESDAEGNKQEAASEERALVRVQTGAVVTIATGEAAGFKELRAVFDNGYIDDVALAFRLYVAARREVGHAAIMEAARMWAAFYVEHNNGAQYLPKLSLWLVDTGWAKQPQKRGRRNGANADAASNNNKPRYGKPNLGNIAKRYGAQMGGNQQ